MRRLIPAVVVGIVTFSLATALFAKEAADAPAGSLKADLPGSLYTRAIVPIEAKVAQAEKVMQAYDKEMEKPEAKRNAARLASCKEKAAALYHAAAVQAKTAGGLMKKEEHKTLVKQQYEDPNRQKAVEMLLELAADAERKKDMRKTVTLYKMILAIDPDNTQAKETLTRLAKSLKKPTGKTSTDNKDDSDDETTKPWKRNKDTKNYSR